MDFPEQRCRHNRWRLQARRSSLATQYVASLCIGFIPMLISKNWPILTAAVQFTSGGTGNKPGQRAHAAQQWGHGSAIECHSVKCHTGYTQPYPSFCHCHTTCFENAWIYIYIYICTCIDRYMLAGSAILVAPWYGPPHPNMHAHTTN